LQELGKTPYSSHMAWDEAAQSTAHKKAKCFLHMCSATTVRNPLRTY